MLLTSEVVTSAVQRTNTGAEVVVVADHPMVRVEVHGERASARRAHLDEASTLRRTLVDALSEAWGVEEVGTRARCTWFEMRS